MLKGGRRAMPGLPFRGQEGNASVLCRAVHFWCFFVGPHWGGI